MSLFFIFFYFSAFFNPEFVYSFRTFSLALVATVNADQIMVFDDEIDAIDAPLANELLHRAVNLQ